MDIDWDLLHRYLANDCTTDERRCFEAWLAEAPMHRRIFHEVRDLALDADRTVPVERQEALLAGLKRQGAGTPPLRLVSRAELASRHQVRRAWRVWRVAAALVGTLGASVLGYRLLQRSPAALATASSSLRTFTTPRSGRLSLRLPDGTLAELAPATTLRLLAGYGGRERAVELAGEAVFTVTHDANRPFTVRTTQLVARDVGTRFVVREYPGDSPADVVDAEGIVSVIGDPTGVSHASDSALLERGDRAQVTSDGRLAVTSGAPLDGYFDWTQGRLVFRGATLGDAAARLERWYDVDIRFASPKLTALRFTSSFEQTEAADDVLRVIADALGLQVVRDGRSYTFRAK
jgi:transmembrane sensor